MAYRPNPFSSRSPHIPSFFPGLSSALIVRLLFLPMHYPLTPSFPSLPCAQEKKEKAPQSQPPLFPPIFYLDLFSVGCLLPASPVAAENRRCGAAATLRRR